MYVNKTRNRRKNISRHSSEGLSREEYVERVRRRKNNEIDDIINDSQEKRASTSRRNSRATSRKVNKRSSKKKNDKNDIDGNMQEELDTKTRIKKKIIKILIRVLIIVLVILFILFIISLIRFTSIAKQMIKNSPSIIVDTSGEKIGEIGSERNRKNISFEEMPDDLKNAYVAIEDERFYKHGGVDIKRTGAATLNYIFSFGKASFGGSTITQQLVKNLTGNTKATVTRKVDEWTKAMALEVALSKEEILEAYLNVIYVGPNVYGVETGAEYYFSKHAKDLSLEECAFLAGINHAPNAYNPFREGEDNSEKIKKRTNTVLNKMLELKYISQEDYNKAKEEVEKGLDFKRGDIDVEKEPDIYSYHTDALISEVIKDISERKHISEEFATNYLYMANLKIYSTQNNSIQETMEKEFNKKMYLLDSKNTDDATSQAAMVVIDNKTGYVVGCVGGLGEKETSRGFNRATQAKRQTGSAIKPLAILVPGIEKKIFTASTTFVDEETDFNDGSEEPYHPTNYDGYLGEITVRRAVESSQNIPFVKMMEKITPKTSIKYLKKMGITTLTEKDENLALALGGLDSGMTPLETAAAYATIANDGKYIEPTFYTKIETQEGKNVLKSKQKKKKVFSKETAYVVKELLTEPVNGTYGTATYCKMKNMDVAAKTGTTNENYDRWLCGFTSYYSAATWFGFDINETINFNKRNPAGLIWSSVMDDIHEGLEGKRFEKPKKVVTCTVCSKTGKKATKYCGDTYEEYYIKGTEPTECTYHSSKNKGKKNENNKAVNKNTVDESKNTENEKKENDDKVIEEVIVEKPSNNNNNSDDVNANENKIENNIDSNENSSQENPNEDSSTSTNTDKVESVDGSDSESSAETTDESSNPSDEKMDDAA